MSFTNNEQPNRTAGDFRTYWIAGLFFVLATLLTDAFFMADAADYANAIEAVRNGNGKALWDFNHLLWLPLGWLTTEATWNVSDVLVGSAVNTKIMFALVALTWLFSLAGVLGLVYLLRHFCVDNRVVLLTTVAFVSTQGFLNYSQAGTSYAPGLAALIWGLGLLARGATAISGDSRSSFKSGLAAGAVLAFSVCLWLPYLWALPAALLSPLVFFRFEPKQLRLIASTAAAFTVCVGIAYISALLAVGVTSFAEFRAWMTESWMYHLVGAGGIVRLVFGLARTFINMGNDGLLFKRFLLGDPFSPVSVWSLLGSSVWKLVLFYSFAFSLPVMLRGVEKGLKVLLWLAAAFAFVGGFAFFFAASDIERYLALYPFVFVAIAIGLSNPRAPRAGKIAALVFLLTMAVTNWSVMLKPVQAISSERTVARTGDLQRRGVPPSSLVVLTHPQDELSNFDRSFPFHPFNQQQRAFRLTMLVSPGGEQVKHWRGEFAARAARVWAANGELWVSTRAFSEQPLPEWNWAEGDDKNIRWRDFPEFFTRLQIGETVGGENDGFALIVPSESNRRFLAEYEEAYRGAPLR